MQKEPTMTRTDDDGMRDALLLAGRLLLVLLFLIYGWDKLTGFSGTVAYMTQLGAPMPSLAAGIAVLAELPVAIAVAIGAWTRPMVLLLALYTVGASLIGHPFWAREGAARYGDAINFYKNVSIIGGCLLLCAAGPGRFSLDAWRHRDASRS
jgi:putative oxidoreductase